MHKLPLIGFILTNYGCQIININIIKIINYFHFVLIIDINKVFLKENFELRGFDLIEISFGFI